MQHNWVSDAQDNSKDIKLYSVWQEIQSKRESQSIYKNNLKKKIRIRKSQKLVYLRIASQLNGSYVLFLPRLILIFTWVGLVYFPYYLNHTNPLKNFLYLKLFWTADKEPAQLRLQEMLTVYHPGHSYFLRLPPQYPLGHAPLAPSPTFSRSERSPAERRDSPILQSESNVCAKQSCACMDWTVCYSVRKFKSTPDKYICSNYGK